METAILILILVLCLCLVYVTELMKKMCDKMKWLETPFDNFKDYSNKEFAKIEKQFVSINADNAKKWAEYSKEYAEVMEILLAKHNEINELREQLKSLESEVKEDEDISSLRSKLNGLDYQIKKNEEDTYNAINDKVEHFNKQISSLRDKISLLRDQLTLIECKVEKYKDGTCDNLSTFYSQLQKMDCKVKKNEEDTYKIIKDNERYFGNQVNSLRAMNKKLTFAVEENKEMLNEIRTEMSNKEKEENE